MGIYNYICVCIYSVYIYVYVWICLYVCIYVSVFICVYICDLFGCIVNVRC